MAVGCALLALVGAVLVVRFGAPVLPAIVIVPLGLTLALKRPFALLLLLWFVVALVPHGNLGDLWFRKKLGVPLHPIDLLYWGSLAAWFGRWALERFRLDRLRGHMSLAPPILAVVFAITLSVFVGVVNGHATWDLFRDLRNAALWLMLPVAWVELSTERRIRAALGVIVAGSLLYAVAACVVSTLTDTTWPRSVILDHWRGSARIYFHNHFVFVTVLPLVTGYAIAGRSLASRFLRAAPAPLLIWATWVSITRSLIVLVPAVALLTAGVLVLTSRNRGRWWRPVSAMVAAVVVAAVGYQAIETARPRPAVTVADSDVARRFSALSSDPTKKDVSLKGRVRSYRFAFEDAAVSPTFGHGMGALLRVPWANQLGGPGSTRKKGYQPAVDNAPLTVLVKAGALGFLAAAWLLLAILWLQARAIFAARGAVERLWIPSALLAGTLGMIAVSQLQATLLTSRYIILFAVFAAISDRYANRPSQVASRADVVSSSSSSASSRK